MSRSRIEFNALLLLCGLLAAGGAWALKSDKQQPINIQADHGDFRADPSNNSNGTGIYTGHVVITQGSITLTADRAVLHVINNELDTADISGDPATFQQQPDKGEMIRGYAKQITYDASKDQIDFITDARLIQPVEQANGVILSAPPPATVNPAGKLSPYVSQAERLMTADHIRYNTDTQHMVATGGQDQGRVHISFPPKQLPGETGGSAKARRTEFKAEQAAAEASREAAAAAATAPAPAAATHPGA